VAGLCSICSNAAARDLINSALVAGESPSQIFATYGESLAVSRSSVYRHAAHSRSPLTPDWLDGDTTVTEAASDLGSVRRDLKRRFDAAGPDTSAARLSREIVAVTTALKLRFDVEHDDESSADYAEQIARLFRTVLRDVPGALDFARRQRVSPELAADLGGLAEAIEQYKKEN
jgi:hypothetical protein